MYERLEAKILRGGQRTSEQPIKKSIMPTILWNYYAFINNFNRIVLTIVFSLKPSIHMDYETNKKINALQFTMIKLIKWPFINILLIIMS